MIFGVGKTGKKIDFGAHRVTIRKGSRREIARVIQKCFFQFHGGPNLICLPEFFFNMSPRSSQTHGNLICLPEIELNHPWKYINFIEVLRPILSPGWA